MKRSRLGRRDIEVFSLSFLDAICCGFGAVILLLVLTEVGEPIVFEKALGRLPPGVPVNVILLPMEGDPMAPAAYWTLARRTRGSFLSPARDWP